MVKILDSKFPPEIEFTIPIINPPYKRISGLEAKNQRHHLEVKVAKLPIDFLCLAYKTWKSFFLPLILYLEVYP